MSSGHPRVASCDEATRLAKVSFDRVTMGQPAHKTSIPITKESNELMTKIQDNVSDVLNMRINERKVTSNLYPYISFKH